MLCTDISSSNRKKPINYYENDASNMAGEEG